MSELEKNPVKNPSFGWILSEIFSCAWNPFALAAIAIPSAYALLRSASSEHLGARFDAFERRFAKITRFFHRHTPIIRDIPEKEFARQRPGSALLSFGTVQIPALLVGAAISLSTPTLTGCLMTAATALFAASNIKFGLQLNHIEDKSPISNATAARHPRRSLLNRFRRRSSADMKSERNNAPRSRRGVFKEITTSPIVLDAMGTACTAVVAGVATSFGSLAAIPLAVSFASATLIAYDELSKSKLNIAVPMLSLAGVSIVTACSAAAIGDVFLALANVSCACGDLAFAAISHKEFVDDRPERVPNGLMDRLSFQLTYPRATETDKAVEPPCHPTRPMASTSQQTNRTVPRQMAIEKVGTKALLVIEPRRKSAPHQSTAALKRSRGAMGNGSKVSAPPSCGASIRAISSSNHSTKPDVAFAPLPSAGDRWHRPLPPPGLG